MSAVDLAKSKYSVSRQQVGYVAHICDVDEDWRMVELFDRFLGSVRFTGRLIASNRDDSGPIPVEAFIYETLDGRFVLNVINEDVDVQVKIYDLISSLKADVFNNPYGGGDPLFERLIEDAQKFLDRVSVELTVSQWEEILKSIREHLNRGIAGDQRRNEKLSLGSAARIIESQLTFVR